MLQETFIAAFIIIHSRRIMEILYKAVFTHSAVSLPKVNRFGFFATNDRFRLNLLLCR